jgi:hypothetical protein
VGRTNCVKRAGHTAEIKQVKALSRFGREAIDEQHLQRAIERERGLTRWLDPMHH